MTDAFGRLTDAERHKEWQDEIDRRDEIINSDKQVIAELHAEIEQTRTILAGTDIGSLPNDYPLSKMALEMWNVLQDRTMEGLTLIGRIEAIWDIADSGGRRIEMEYRPIYTKEVMDETLAEITALRARISRLEDENKRLESHVSDLQSGMYINCVYCGHRYGPNDAAPVSMADVLYEHISQCPKHPLSKAAARITELEQALKVARKAALEEAADHCVAAAYAIGAVDGYDYRSGQEDGLRQAERLIKGLSKK